MSDFEGTRMVPDEDLQVGDVVYVLGWKRIVAIEPYRGPYSAECFAVAKTVPGVGFSLWRGVETARLMGGCK